MLSVDLSPIPDGPGESFEADLTTREGNRDAVAAAVERFGGLDVVVANAGLQARGAGGRVSPRTTGTG